jgi:hypothetical protein
MPRKSESATLADIENRLATEFSALGVGEVRSAFERAQASFMDSTVRDFVPLLVERRVRAELKPVLDGR